MKYHKEKIRKQFYLPLHQKEKKIPRNEPTKGGKRPVLSKLKNVDEKLKMSITDGKTYHILGLEGSILLK